MILSSDEVRPRPRFILLEEWIEQYDEYGDDDGYPVYHISVAENRAACTRQFANESQEWGLLTSWSLREIFSYLCPDCREKLDEHSGSVPPDDPTYRTEVGYSPRHSGGYATRITDRSDGSCTVGVPAATARMEGTSRTQWSSLTEREQRQVVFAANGVERSPGTNFRRPVFHLSRSSTGDGPVFIVF